MGSFQWVLNAQLAQIHARKGLRKQHKHMGNQIQVPNESNFRSSCHVHDITLDREHGPKVRSTTTSKEPHSLFVGEFSQRTTASPPSSSSDQTTARTKGQASSSWGRGPVKQTRPAICRLDTALGRTSAIPGKSPKCRCSRSNLRTRGTLIPSSCSCLVQA